MLLRGTSVMNGAKALALAGLLGLASGTMAQPPAAPPPKAAEPPKSAPPAALVPNPANQDSVLSLIGNKPSGNADVTFVNGDFVANGQPVAAGNEYAVLEAGSFRGIVTSVDDSGRRVSLPGANLYLIRRGQVVARSESGPNGGFTFTNVVSGGYTLLATVGGYGTAEVALNGVPGVEQGVLPYAAPVVPRPVASPYVAGMTAGVPGAVAVRFPYQAIAVQRIALRDGAVAASRRIDQEKEGAEGVLVKAAANQPVAHSVPVINLSPAPWEDLRLLIGTAQFEPAPLGLAPTPATDFGGGIRRRWRRRRWFRRCWRPGRSRGGGGDCCRSRRRWRRRRRRRIRQPLPAVIGLTNFINFKADHLVRLFRSNPSR